MKRKLRFILVKIKYFLDYCYWKARQHKNLLLWIIIVFVVVFVLIAILLSLYLVFVYPVNQVSQLGINNATEKTDLIIKYRTSSIQLISIFAQIFGGIALFIGIYFAWNNFKLSQEGQITDRYTRAVDQLGNPKIEVRLGGIYALERLAKESEKDYWPILEILTAYVRNNSTVDTLVKATPLNIVPISMDIQANERKKSEVSEVIDELLDIQAILTVIARRKYYYKHGETNSLNLKRTNLKHTNLSGANLSWANLSGVNLSQVDLSRVNLYYANLNGAFLSRANLCGANLHGADLYGANFEGASLSWANLSWAILYKANLTEADLSGADLSEAHLSWADLSFANLSWANLYATDLSFANLNGANLYGAKISTIGQLSEVETLYNAKLDTELEKQLKEKYPHLFIEPNQGDKIIADL